MKQLFSKAPLFVFIYVSLIAILIATQFVPTLENIFPEFANLDTRITDTYTSLTNSYTDENLATKSNSEDVVDVTSVVPSPLDDTSSTPEISVSEDADYEEIILAQIYQTNNNVEKIITAKLSEIQSSGRGGFYSFAKVDKSYFDNVLFIGDSRTVGLSLYSELDNADFAADVGMTIYDIFDRRISFNNSGRSSVGEVLASRKYSKIYIMLGINECGGNPDTWIKTYSDVIARIQASQPSAIIVIQGIMKVGAGKSASSRTINNTNITILNEKLKGLANGWNIYYLDINPAVCDENGNLTAGYSFDQVHLYAKYYKLWEDYLLSHGLK